jgi:aspartate/methionine/tyrosine aminotransferase
VGVGEAAVGSQVGEAAANRPLEDHHGTGRQLADHLLSEYGTGVLAGEAFGDSPEALRFRVATSLL